MSRNTYQKVTTSGRPIVNDLGLPVFTRSIYKRLRTVREMLTIGLHCDDEKWFNIASDIKMIKV